METIALTKLTNFADRMSYLASKFKADAEWLSKVNFTDEEKEKYVFTIIDALGTILKLKDEEAVAVVPVAEKFEFVIDTMGLQRERLAVLSELQCILPDKIRAIKAFRTLFFEMNKRDSTILTAGLKESKDEVERIWFNDKKFTCDVWEYCGFTIGRDLLRFNSRT